MNKEIIERLKNINNNLNKMYIYEETQNYSLVKPNKSLLFISESFYNYLPNSTRKLLTDFFINYIKIYEKGDVKFTDGFFSDVRLSKNENGYLYSLDYNDGGINIEVVKFGEVKSDNNLLISCIIDCKEFTQTISPHIYKVCDMLIGKDISNFFNMSPISKRIMNFNKLADKL